MKHRLVFLFALAAGLSACTPTLPGSFLAGTAETAATRETADTAVPTPSDSAAPEDDTAAMPESLQPMDLAVLPYDEIRLVYHYVQFDPPVSGYYTMSQNGRWGLMRNDGSVVLPCEFDQPIAMCSDGTPEKPAWLAFKEDADKSFWESTTQYLTVVNEGRICFGEHCGPGYEFYFWDEAASQMFAYIGTLGPSIPTYISPDQRQSRGWWFPTRPGTLYEADWGLAVDYDTSVPFRYRSAEGTLLNNYEYQQAELFYNGALLAAARRGSKWVYLDGYGREVTEPVYDPVYSSVWSNTGFASPLLNGYAAVSRDGQFGLLDSAGLEYLPCQYQGVVWDGGLGWLQLDDGWHAFRIPSAAAQTPVPYEQSEEDFLSHVPLTTVFPDTYPGNGRRTEYTTLRDDNLNVRAGPGTQYDKLGSIPPGSPVRELGTSSTVSGWTFVLYDDWLCGWVSTEYLE